MAVREWEAKPAANRTWSNIKIFMAAEYAKENKQNKQTAKQLKANAIEEQAEAIEKAAHDRPEMKYIAISDKPRRANGNLRTIKTFADMGGLWLKYWSPII